MPDAGTYTLRGENRNGSDKVRKHHQQITNILIIFLTIGMKVDLDLVVLETGHDAECELLRCIQLAPSELPPVFNLTLLLWPHVLLF